MRRQFYPPYTDPSEVPVTVSDPQDSQYATSGVEGASEVFGYGPFEGLDPQYGSVGNPSQGYLIAPAGQGSTSQRDASLEVFQGGVAEEGGVILQSQQGIARERRRAQNRAAQKAFRYRKEARIKELERKLTTLEKDYEKLESAFGNLKTEKDNLQTELESIKMEKNSSFGDSITSSPASTAEESRIPPIILAHEGSHVRSREGETADQDDEDEDEEDEDDDEEEDGEEEM
ncbi:hypothetical protein MMC12_003645 [Toensbergia leucococca]|nr:hypothetical protein [Toensbergia leucococca]